MTAFYVGQMVRIVRNVGPEISRSVVDKLIGTESRIAGMDVTTGPPGHSIRLAGLPFFCFHPYDLEPIAPKGHESCDEDFKRDLDRMLERVTERVR